MFEVQPKILNEVLARFSDHEFMIGKDRVLTFADFFQDVFSMSRLLELEKKQRVVICSENQEFVLKNMMAICLKGGVAVPVNPKFPESKIRNLMEQVGCRKLLSDSEIPTGNQKKSSGLMKEVDFSIEPEAWATVIFTSGSSGSPKAVLHNLSQHFFSALGANQRMPFKPGDRWLLSLPLFHVGGLAIFFRALLSGAAFVIPEKNEELGKTLKNHKITHLSLVPTQLFRLLKNAENREYLSQLKLILLGGAAIPETLMEEAEKLGLNVQRTYGCTEMASQISTAHKILPYRELRISDDQEISVRGQTRFLGYLNRHHLVEPFDAEGWFQTGDLGFWQNDDSSGSSSVFLNSGANQSTSEKKLRVLGRKDNMFISGGENIHPEEIERLIHASALIEQVLVVAVKDQEFGARPVAFLKSESPFDGISLRNFLKNHLAKFQIPDLFLSWPMSLDTSLKPSRAEFGKYAQNEFDLWQFSKNQECSSQDFFEKWAEPFELGWMKVGVWQEKQIFKILDSRDKTRIRNLLVLANSRQEVMNWLLASENMSMFNYQNSQPNQMSWNPEFHCERGEIKGDFEIVRLLENEIPKTESIVFDAENRGEIENQPLKLDSSKIALENDGASNFSFSEMKTNHLLLMKKYQEGWNWEFTEAVFQTATFLNQFKRMYLLRCLFRRKENGIKFLGWKAQLIRDIGKPEDCQHPFWNISQEEEKLLEKHLLECGLMKVEDRKTANIPSLERKRRNSLQEQLVSHFQ